MTRVRSPIARTIAAEAWELLAFAAIAIGASAFAYGLAALLSLSGG
jgi:hypothetical protein